MAVTKPKPKPAASKKAAPVPKKADAPKSAASDLETIKADVVANRELNPSAAQRVELAFREDTKHHIIPSATKIAIDALPEGADKLRVQLRQLGINAPVIEGGGTPVGPQDEYVSQAWGTRRPGDVIPGSGSLVSATDQTPPAPKRFAKAGAPGPAAGTVPGKDFGKDAPEKSLKRVKGKKAAPKASDLIVTPPAKKPAKKK